MIKAGILVQQLDISQLGIYICNNLNTMATLRWDIDIIVYYDNWAKAPMPPNFCTMCTRNAWGLEGTLIATDLKTAQRLIKCPGPQKKYFYVWNLEWINMRNANYEALRSIYNHPDIELIARSQYHADVIERVWRKPVAIMEDFNSDKLVELIQ